jgi:tRNA dimethylallyltransferase
VTKIPLLVIAGPTAAGKTATAVALSRRLPIEIVSADSRQVYRSMDTATGKPTLEERRAVRHHLVDIVDPDDRYDAARFRREAANAIDRINASGRLAVVVGGTGLYIRALLRGLDPAPPADLELRRHLEAVAARDGGRALHERLGREAPELARRLHPNDRVRVVRAFELLRAGSPVGSARQRWCSDESAYRVVYVGLTTERELLARRLRARVQTMIASGLEDEVRQLLERGYDAALPAMHGIGYRQFVAVARGTTTREQAARLMERDTVRYAKRQLTWFAREPQLEWCDVEATGGAEGCAEEIEQMVRRAGLVA